MSEFDDIMERARRAYAGGRPDEAMGLLDRAGALATEIGKVRLIAGLHRRFGRLPQAAAALRRVLALDPGAPDAWLHLTLMAGEVPLEARDLEELRGVYAAASAETRVPLGFALANVLADHGDIDAAAGLYAEANAARRASLDWSIDDLARTSRRVRDTFTPEFFARFAEAGDRTVAPIFIVGMPRSGSSLTEQILASHRDVMGGGEMNLLSRIDRTMIRDSGATDLAAALEAIGSGGLKPWIEAYLQPVRTALAASPIGRTRFTDKNLENFVRVGLIRILFPDARVIHCVRDPLDTCLSIWRRLFAGDSVPYAYDQVELGTYHRLHEAIMAHWHDVLPGFVLEQRYETLVAEPEHSIRRMLAFCGLEWDDNCLAFHRTERGIATASAAQVRRPLHSGAVGGAGKWRPYLAPLIAALDAPLHDREAGRREQP